jgi:hypothetical protein
MSGNIEELHGVFVWILFSGYTQSDTENTQKSLYLVKDTSMVK